MPVGDGDLGTVRVVVDLREGVREAPNPGADPKVKGKVRKDKNLVPVNNDFDLYSMGKDGASTPAFTAKMSQDDIVRANNGKYVGLVADY